MVENAATRPYHCAEYCFLPCEFVRGSWNVASSCIFKVYLLANLLLVYLAWAKKFNLQSRVGVF